MSDINAPQKSGNLGTWRPSSVTAAGQPGQLGQPGQPGQLLVNLVNLVNLASWTPGAPSSFAAAGLSPA